ncbi:hydrolase [Streptomyces spiroverticillatus]|uniref:Hydrolase n=1 Tax=Streptomyces finlayi TaxID=67296 RepID=A0A919C9F5_9ACTN|nr:PHB depolymerase family esterase [Streptomyces finlayi]GHA04731.1 hydrolase [Streptomyces spiroverticillatus]GHC88744.1 hydrolase [Streptomyces finlayi]
MRTSPGTALRVSLWTAGAAVLLTLTGCGGNEKPPLSNKPATKPPSPAPAPEVPRAGDQKITMTWKGQQRVYRVHAPPGYSPSKPLPLVVGMHMYPGDGDRIAALSGLNAKADTKNFLVAYPDGLNSGYNALICCGAEDDVGFIKAVVQRLVTTWKADPDRIYATGISNGADMSFKLAVEAPGVFAAVAPVSGAFSGSATNDAAYIPTSPVSVMTFVGGQDRVKQVADMGIETWQERLNCKTKPPQKLRNGITRVAAKCKDSSDFVTYNLPEMGHFWPGATAGTMADEEAGISATDLMWDFFASHPKK